MTRPYRRNWRFPFTLRPAHLSLKPQRFGSACYVPPAPLHIRFKRWLRGEAQSLKLIGREIREGMRRSAPVWLWTFMFIVFAAAVFDACCRIVG